MTATSHPRSARLCRALRLGGLVLVVVNAPSAWMAARAGATPSTPTLTVTPSAAGHPYVNGQSVRIAVSPNSSFSPYSRIEVLECAAPKGVLPIDDTTCDGNTTQYGSVLVAADGSFDVPVFTIYQLPNSVLGEPAHGLPVCNQLQQCVLYIGQDQNDFTKPKLFSATFTVDPSTSPTSPGGLGTTVGGSAAAGGQGASGATGAQPHASSATRTPSSPSGIALTGPSSQATGVLAYTGVAGLPWLVGIGTLMVLAGTAGTRIRRRTI